MERRKHLRAKPTILKNCVHPRMQPLIGAVLVALIKERSFNTSIKPGRFCLHALQVKKCFGLTIFLDCVCMKVYQI